MSVLWGLISVALAFVVVLTIFDVARRHLGRGRAAAWILVIIIFPFLGALVYWTLRPPSQAELQQRQSAEHDLRQQGPRARRT